MSFFCICGSRLLLLIILLFIKQRKQGIAVKCLFCKILKRKSSQMKILKLLSFAKFHRASDDIFLKFLWSKLNFLQKKQTSIWTKKSFKVDFFAISWIECILNYPFYDSFNISPTNCEDFRLIAQIHYLWCGYEEIAAKFI